jgi:hypothetical protein
MGNINIRKREDPQSLDPPTPEQEPEQEVPEEIEELESEEPKPKQVTTDDVSEVRFISGITIGSKLVYYTQALADYRIYSGNQIRTESERSNALDRVMRAAVDFFMFLGYTFLIL